MIELGLSNLPGGPTDSRLWCDPVRRLERRHEFLPQDIARAGRRREKPAWSSCKSDDVDRRKLNSPGCGPASSFLQRDQLVSEPDVYSLFARCDSWLTATLVAVTFWRKSVTV